MHPRKMKHLWGSTLPGFEEPQVVNRPPVVMPHPNGLTPAQQKAVSDWWDEQERQGIEYEYADNTRYARKGTDEEWAYDCARTEGCCGSVDVELTCADGTVLLFGFNYGH